MPMPRNEPEYTPRSANRGAPPRPNFGPQPPNSESDSTSFGSPGDLQLVIISPENLDAVVAKAQAINQAHQRGLLGPAGSDAGYDSSQPRDLRPNGNCPRCTNNLC